MATSVLAPDTPHGPNKPARDLSHLQPWPTRDVIRATVTPRWQSHHQPAIRSFSKALNTRCVTRSRLTELQGTNLARTVARALKVLSI